MIAYGVFREGGRTRVGARVDGGVLDLGAALGDEVFRAASLNPFMARGPGFWRETHARVKELDAPLLEPDGVELLMPFDVADYVDIELEAGFVVGVPSALGEPVPVERALDHVFGMVLVNDWSARDIQAWEYQPLGPFLGKSFATSVCRWVVPLVELEGRRVAAAPQEPEPLPYLLEEPWAYDFALEVELNGTMIARTNMRHLYWSITQQVAHLTVNGASLRTGDLLATGTISGPEHESRGCLLELSWNGEEPIELPGGETRTFLEDGDEVVLRGEGIGEVRGRIEPASQSDTR